MTNDYFLAHLGLWLILFTMIVQATIAAVVKAKEPGAIPGTQPQKPQHSSFVFRAFRTNANTIENAVPTLGLITLSLFVEANALGLAALIWLYAISRIIHMSLYYVIATEKNPSPRSYFFLLGFFAQLGLLILSFSALI